MDKEQAQKLIDKYDEVSEKYVSSKYLFSKLLVSISITLVGLLASLTKFETLDYNSKFFFLTSLSLLVLCILFSLIFLFSEQSYLKKEAGIRMNMLSKYMGNPSGNKLQVEYSGINKFALFCEKLSFLCFGLWSISLIVYIYSMLF